MKRIAIIPARGGSKRIPRKNIKLFLGRPMIAYSIQVALESGVFDTVLVSTDDEEIAAVSKSFGAAVPFLRSAENANDHATVADVLLEVINNLAAKGEHYDEVCCLFATAPFLTVSYVKEVHRLLGNSDAAFTVQRFDAPIFRALKQNEKGCLEMIWPEHRNTRSQDLPEAFHDAGQLYWIKTKTLLAEKTLFAENTRGFVLPGAAAVDIDTEDDWKKAEVLYQLMASGRL